MTPAYSSLKKIAGVHIAGCMYRLPVPIATAFVFIIISLCEQAQLPMQKNLTYQIHYRQNFKFKFSPSLSLRQWSVCSNIITQLHSTAERLTFQAVK